MKKCTLICNLESGKGIKKEDVGKIISLISKHGYDVTYHITTKQGDAKNYVQTLDPDTDLVLSIGGDGTFNEVLTGNYKREKKLVLSHIPVGTTNDIGSMFGMGKNILKNVENILDGEVKQVDIGLINKQPFMYVSGFGKFINVPYETSRKLKKSLGYFAYLVNGVKEFIQKTKLYELEYKVDGKVYRGLYSLILISNANHIAGFNHIYKDVKLNDNKIEIVFCNITRKKDLVKSIAILLKSGITNVPGLYCHAADEIEINFKNVPKECWTIDGEKYPEKTKKYTFSIDKATYMLLPKKNLKELFIEEKEKE